MSPDATSTDGFSIEQQQAIAMANARMRMASGAAPQGNAGGAWTAIGEGLADVVPAGQKITNMIGATIATNVWALMPLSHSLTHGQCTDKIADWVPQECWESTGYQYWPVLHFGVNNAMTLEWQEIEVGQWYVEEHAAPLRYFLRLTSGDRDETIEVSSDVYDQAVVGEQFR